MQRPLWVQCTAALTRGTRQRAHHAHVAFADGMGKVVDLRPHRQRPIFAPIREDGELFANNQMKGGTICWTNGADIDPDVNFYDLRPAWMEESEPS